MGIDVGSHTLGYAAMADIQTLVDAGTVSSQSKDLGKRLHIIHHGLLELLAHHKPDLVVVETPFISRKFMNAVIPLTHARGVVLLAIAQLGLKRRDLSAPEAKAAIGAPARGKEGVQRVVTALLSLEAEPPPDVADAIALAIAGLGQSDGMSARCSHPPPARKRPRRAK